jgi:acyl-CoA thioesterase II
VDAQHFLGMEPVGDRSHWRLPVTEAVATPARFLYGGCGLGAGIVAMEAATGRPTVWATAQYLAHALIGSVLDIEVTVAATGGHVTQARAVARNDGDEVLTVNAALGSYEDDPGATWVEMPAVPSVDASRRRNLPEFFPDSVLSRVDQRQASGRSFEEMDGTPGPPDSATWMRVPGHLEPSAATLAVMGDMVSGGMSQPLGRLTSGRSLDNTLRVVRLVATEWILVDVQMHALANGFGHGLAHLWAEDGTLLATASQSVGVRPWSDAQVAAILGRTSTRSVPWSSPRAASRPVREDDR